MFDYSDRSIPTIDNPPTGAKTHTVKSRHRSTWAPKKRSPDADDVADYLSSPERGRARKPRHIPFD